MNGNARKHIRIPLPSGLALCIIFLAGACSMNPGTPTGFLKGGYGSMSKSEGSESFKSHIPSPDELANYSRVIIEPVVVQKHEGAEMKRIDEEELAQLKAYFEEQLKAEFGKAFQIVSRRGKGTLRVRVAITNARGSVAALNIHYSTLLTRGGVGGGAMEAEFLDSRGGRQIAAFMDSRMGSPFGYFDGFSEIGHAKQVIRLWSKKLAGAATGKSEPEPTKKTRKPIRSR